MAMFLALLFVMLTLAIATANTSPSNMHETCVDGNIGFVLQFNMYQNSCPEAEAIIFSWVQSAISVDPRMAASLLRLHFHDCFVNAILQGCDASVLLDDTDNFLGEKTAPPNLNSLRGFEVIDAIKSDVESVCPGIVSCADILATVARDSVVLVRGPSWEVEMGRRDSLSASKAAATNNIPGPNSTVTTLVAKFQSVGLTLNDMVVLSGAHTMGKARCTTFNSRLQEPPNSNGPDINLDFLQTLQQLCLDSNSDTTLAELDLVTPVTFDNQYFVNLLSGKGLLPSDQALLTQDDRTRQIVESYAQDQFAFFEDFKNSMLKMGRLGPLTGDSGKIRQNCRAIN
ncbi:peroxidase domain-containing protein [Cephalotus follicularis]|uniref:Peroxidase n=1 Tax=Cephalotus follicularis TaxID=3775 RepID=A0A1Q3BUM5_CEPFO|nr:peroxidase domain-containing protein [Cephalotus follicularis]